MHPPAPQHEDTDPGATDFHALVLTPNARTVLEKRYLRLDDEGGALETPEALFHRVARTIAEVDGAYAGGDRVAAWERTFYNLLADLRFLPNTPTLMNAGASLGQLAACFVLPVGDSLPEIFDAIKHAALIHKSGGGTGFAFSRLRPADDVVQSTHGVSSGPVSFMRVFDTATETIKQGGARRGANMGVLRVDHPDVLGFVRCKHGSRTFTNFNLSVGITDAFMRALASGDAYPLSNPRTGAAAQEISAREVWDAIVAEAWINGDPGLVFLDRINADNPTPALGDIEGTNPCGEQPLLPYEACNLGSINLGRFVRKHDGQAAVDFGGLRTAVRVGVRFLDNVIDANRYPLPEIEAITRGNRKIGLGVMGFADLLIRLGLPYDSEAALHTADTVAGFIRREADAASQELAAERGVFPNWERSVFAERNARYRNATRTTVAPTGTISIIAGATGGIEPLFGVAFVRRNILDGTPMIETNPLFEEVARARGFARPDLTEDIAERGSLEGVRGVPEDIRRLFVTAHEIAPEWHVRMQAAFQRHTDNGVSKTVNLPADAPPEAVDRTYRLAYDLGCKGVTMYRDRSRDVQVLNLPHGPEPVRGIDAGPAQRAALDSSHTHHVATAAGTLCVTVHCDAAGRPVDILAATSDRSIDITELGTLCRVASLALRAGVPPETVAREFDAAPATDAVAAVLREYATDPQCPACDDPDP